VSRNGADTAVGTDVAISDRCSIYGAGSITIGSHVRIDDFAILTPHRSVVSGSYVHISAIAFLSGPFGIVIEDFVNVAPGAALLSGNDNFSGQWLSGATNYPNDDLIASRYVDDLADVRLFHYLRQGACDKRRDFASP
jgi:hypothetical protein